MQRQLSFKPSLNNRRVVAATLISVLFGLWEFVSHRTPGEAVDVAPSSVPATGLSRVSTPTPVQQVIPAPAKFVVKTAEIDKSQTFDESLARLGVTPTVSAELVTAFAGTLDFRHDVRAGDQVTLVFRNPSANVTTAASSRPIAVQVSSTSQSHRIVLYKNLDGHAFYYRGDGESTKPAFSRYPIAYTRISSPFSRRRLDPITHRWQAHDGVDLAAPIGTPVHATSAGTITFIGRETGYGRLIIIKNQPPYTTRFAHLSRFAKGLQRGDHVRRGQVIAYVGKSGWATGPHLHFEVREDHVAMNPLTVDLPHAPDLQGKDKERFAKEENELNTLL